MQEDNSLKCSRNSAVQILGRLFMKRTYKSSEEAMLMTNQIYYKIQ
jgi:hypothetical protein